MSVMLSILQGVLLTVLACFAIWTATYVFTIGTGVVGWAAIFLLRLPSWVRWIILLPALVLSGLLLMITFNIIFWIGGWFGDSFIGTAWMWVTTFTQAVVVPRMLVAAGYATAPNGRRWISVGIMIMVWVWVAGVLLDAETVRFSYTESDFWGFYGALVVTAGSAAYAVHKYWNLDLLYRLLESDMRGESDTEIPSFCHMCGTEMLPSDSICPKCSAEEASPQTASDHFARGKSLYDLGRYDQAIQDFGEVINLDPIYAAAYFWRGMSCNKLGHDKQAIQDFSEVIRLDPTDAAAYLWRGQSRDWLDPDEDQYPHAIQDFSEAIRLDSTNAEAYYQRGLWHLIRGYEEWAIPDFDEVIKLVPTHAEAYQKKGLSHRRLDQYEQAIEDFNMALALDPQDVHSYRYRSEIHEKLGNVEEAERDLQKDRELQDPS